MRYSQIIREGFYWFHSISKNKPVSELTLNCPLLWIFNGMTSHPGRIPALHPGFLGEALGPTQMWAEWRILVESNFCFQSYFKACESGVAGIAANTTEGHPVYLPLHSDVMSPWSFSFIFQYTPCLFLWSMKGALCKWCINWSIGGHGLFPHVLTHTDLAQMLWSKEASSGSHQCANEAPLTHLFMPVLDPTNAVLAIIPLLSENESLEEDSDCAMHALVTPIRNTLQRQRHAFQMGDGFCTNEWGDVNSACAFNLYLIAPMIPFTVVCKGVLFCEKINQYVSHSGFSVLLIQKEGLQQFVSLTWCINHQLWYAS